MTASDRDAQTGATKMRDEASAWQMLLALRRKGGPAACAIAPGAPADVAADPRGADSVREPDEQLDLFLAQVAQSKITLRLIL